MAAATEALPGNRIPSTFQSKVQRAVPHSKMAARRISNKTERNTISPFTLAGWFGPANVA